ncbi:Nn.00g064190.m01.CDS01 [Neocucurbitaria sp. VM-36]
MAGFGTLLVRSSGCWGLFGIDAGHVYDFGNGSGSTNRTVGGDNLLLRFVPTGCEVLRLDFIDDRFGVDTDELDDETLESQLIDDLVETGVLLPLVLG